MTKIDVDDQDSDPEVDGPGIACILPKGYVFVGIKGPISKKTALRALRVIVRAIQRNGLPREMIFLEEETDTFH